MKTIIRKLVVSGVMLGMFGASAPAFANTFYVATNGSDSNPGTESQPFRTITNAYSQASAGTTIIVEPGTYTDYQSGWGLHLGSSGTATNPIVLESQVHDEAIIDGQNAADRNKGIYIDGSYNVVNGFEIKNAPSTGIAIFPDGNGNAASGIHILNCEIDHNGNTNGGNGIFDDPTSFGNFYTGNYIHDNGRISQNINLDQGMYLCGSNNEVVANNLIVRNCAYGIQVAAYNTISNIEIFNNTIVSNLNRGGIVLWSVYTNLSPMYDIDIANNIIYGNANANGNVDPGIATWTCAGSGVQINSNLFFDNSGGTWNMTPGGSTVSYTASDNITNSDPEFFNVANDWHLQKCSPAIDSGLTLGPVTNDFDGLPRPIPWDGAYDIGAYER